MSRRAAALTLVVLLAFPGVVAAQSQDGTPRADNLVGTTGPDTINGRGGNDRIRGRAGEGEQDDDGEGGGAARHAREGCPRDTVPCRAERISHRLLMVHEDSLRTTYHAPRGR